MGRKKETSKVRINNIENRQTVKKIRLRGEISIASDMQMTPPSWQKVKRNEKAS